MIISHVHQDLMVVLEMVLSIPDPMAMNFGCYWQRRHMQNYMVLMKLYVVDLQRKE
jgi:hypothetical protein